MIQPYSRYIYIYTTEEVYKPRGVKYEEQYISQVKFKNGDGVHTLATRQISTMI